MRSVIVAVTTVLAVSLAASASAQSGWGMATPGFGAPFGYVGNDGDWARCTNADRIHPLERVVESCNRLLAERPGHLNSGGIYWYRAMRYIDAEMFQQADDDLKLAVAEFAAHIEANPREYVGYNNRAAVLTRLGRYDEALADYDRAAALESYATSPLLGRGNLLFRRGDYAGAIDSFDRAARIAARTASTYTSHHTTRCVARAAAGVELDRARHFCDRAVRGTDQRSYALTARGFYFFRQGDLSAAAADFARAVDEDQFNAPALYGRGVVAARQHAGDGQADMERALAMDRFEVEYYANAGLRP